MNETIPHSAAVDRLYDQLLNEGEAVGYHLNPDIDFTRELVRGLLINDQRYGYFCCPCRLADGTKDSDLDIICPCDYRDEDLNDYDSCFCRLYVSGKVMRGETQIGSIPERRPESGRTTGQKGAASNESSPKSVWRCRVCGYLCAREHPPESCPICKAEKERFEIFVRRALSP